MSVKNKIIIPAAALALFGGIGTAGALAANAATTACGSSCTDFYNADLTGSFMLSAPTQVAGAGQPIECSGRRHRERGLRGVRPGPGRATSSRLA